MYSIHYVAVDNSIIGASLSEPHTDAVAGDLVGIYIYMCVCVCRTSCHKFPFSRARWPHCYLVLIAALGCGVHRPAVSCAHLAPVTTIGFVARSQKSKFIGAATTFSFEREVDYSNETLAAYRPYPSSMLSSILCTRRFHLHMAAQHQCLPYIQAFPYNVVLCT